MPDPSMKSKKKEGQSLMRRGRSQVHENGMLWESLPGTKVVLSVMLSSSRDSLTGLPPRTQECCRPLWSRARGADCFLSR